MNYSQMSREMSIELRRYLVFFAVLIFIFTLAPEIRNGVKDFTDLKSFLDDQDTVFRVITLAIVPMVQVIIVFLASFLVHSELHISLDRLTFNMRRRGNSIIVDTLTRNCEVENCPYVERIRSEPQIAMRHFYHLTDEMKPDASQVFDRWGRYYLNLYLLLFSLLIALACVILRLAILPLDRFVVSAIVFGSIAVLLLFNVVQIRPKLEELARSSPSQLLAWNEDKVLTRMLSICQIERSACPWANRENTLKQLMKSLSNVRYIDRLARSVEKTIDRVKGLLKK